MTNQATAETQFRRQAAAGQLGLHLQTPETITEQLLLAVTKKWILPQARLVLEQATSHLNAGLKSMFSRLLLDKHIPSLPDR
jgi:hypothetical protein